jgi:hypothetical protein
MATRTRSKSFEQIRGELERMERESLADRGPSPEEAKRILDERARSLARITHGTANDAPRIESVRGEIVAVVELSALFDAPRAPPPTTNAPALSAGATTSFLLVIGQEQAELALRCEEVAEVASLRRDRILAPPRAATFGGRRDVLGVTDDAILVLDAAALLEDPRLFVEQTEEIEV